MMRFLVIAAAAATASAATSGKWENFVTFGDSYTDEGRLGYFINNHGQPPPVGTLMPESNTTATGGKAWGRVVADLTGANYYDYAVSGATCSNEIISRYFSAINAPFPSVVDYEIPAFKNDTAVKALYPDRQANNTVYALWIGTNDLGVQAFLFDSQAPGTTISDYVDCVWSVFDSIYATGGRVFALLNVVPLELTGLYAPGAWGSGAIESQWWTNKTAYNNTEYAQKIREYSTNVNTIFDYGAPFQLLVKKRWPGASVSVVDVHQLISDIHADGAKYLTAPANVTGYYSHCDPNNSSHCVDSTNPLSSFLWYDELHPSARTSEIVAQTFVDVINGNSTYGTTYSS